MPAVHRLNRTEYNNAVRDLFALDIDPTWRVPTVRGDEGGINNPQPNLEGSRVRTIAVSGGNVYVGDVTGMELRKYVRAK